MASAEPRISPAILAVSAGIAASCLLGGAFPGDASAQENVHRVDPTSHRVYDLGTFLTGPCLADGRIPADAGCGASGTERFRAVKVSTAGWSGEIGPPACKPVKLELEGRYRGVIFEASSDWAGDTCYPNIGKVYFTRSNRVTEMIEFTFEVQRPRAACEAENPDWLSRSEEEAEAYRDALAEHLGRRPALAALAEQAENSTGIVQRQAESRLWDIEDGLDMIRDDCLRLAEAVTENCQEISDCGEDIAAAIRAGPGAFCLAVHEIFTGFRGGAATGTQAHAWFARDFPCIAKLYDRGDFLDMVEALADSRQPLAGFSPARTTSPGLPALK